MYLHAAPPSYEESVLFGYPQIEDEEDQHPIGHQRYTPRYPVYHFNDDVVDIQVDAQVNASATDEASSSVDANLHSEKLREKIGNWN